MKQVAIGLLLLFSLPCVMVAQEVELTIEVSQQKVKVGEPFTVTISLRNAQADIQTPQLDDFDILSGPNYSSSFSMINGKTDMSSSYTYKLSAPEEGKFTIGSATVEIDGTELYTDPIVMEVEYDPNYTPDQHIFPSQKRIKKKKPGIRL